MVFFFFSVLPYFVFFDTDRCLAVFFGSNRKVYTYSSPGSNCIKVGVLGTLTTSESESLRIFLAPPSSSAHIVTRTAEISADLHHHRLLLQIHAVCWLSRASAVLSDLGSAVMTSRADFHWLRGTNHNIIIVVRFCLFFYRRCSVFGTPWTDIKEEPKG